METAINCRCNPEQNALGHVKLYKVNDFPENQMTKFGRLIQILQFTRLTFVGRAKKYPQCEQCAHWRSAA